MANPNEVYIYTKLLGVNDVINDIKTIEKHLLRLTQRWQQMQQTAQQTVNTTRPNPQLNFDFNKLQQTLDALVAQMQNFNTNASKMAQVSNRASQKVSSMGKSVKKTTSFLGMGLKTMLKYTLGISSLVAVLGKLRSAVIQGFSNLAQFNGGLNPTNQALSRLKSSLTQMKNSFAAAFAPILQVVEPVLTRIINLISSVMTHIGMLIAAITGAKTFTKAIAVQENYAKSLSGTAKSAKEANKQLAGFDKLNVINSKSDDGGSGTTDPSKMFKTVEIEGKIAALGAKLRNVFNGVFDFFGQIKERISNWFGGLNFEPLIKSFTNLKDKVMPIVETIGNLILLVMDNVLLPLGTWTIESALPTFLDSLSEAAGFLNTAFETLQPGLEYAWQNLIKPIGQFAGEVFLKFLESAKTLFSALQKVFEEKGGKITNILEALTNTASVLWSYGFKPVFQFISQGIFTLMSYIDDVVGDIIDIFDGLADFLTGVFTGDWERCWTGIKKIFFGVINFILDKYSAVVNGIIDGLNAMSFEVPSWVPGVGGQKFGFNLERLDISKFKIPALATGTVVPRSSDEFLAKLGDNNRETEVVSPLSTMKQAFLEAMRDSGMQNNSEIVSLLRIIAAKELVVPTDDVFVAMQNKAYEFRMTNGTDAFL